MYPTRSTSWALCDRGHSAGAARGAKCDRDPAAVLIALPSPETPKLLVTCELLRDKGTEGQMNVLPVFTPEW